MMRNRWTGVSLAAIAMAYSAAADAQSTGSREFDEIVVTASRTPAARGVAGVVIPDTAKTREVLTADYVQHQTPGQSVDEIINQLPGVSFQNNDPYGSAGGTLNIRGFDGSRISQTFDGIPLNDTGNYAIYSNQQLDPELIDQVNVSLGSTDIDSPTASATGSTVNYVTRNPSDDFHLRLQGSVGEYHYFRPLAILDTGVIGPFGTKAWLEASDAENNVPFNSFGRIKKQQYNAKVYQPLGSNGDFISVAGHYNQNRNNFFGSEPLRVDLTQSPTNPAPRIVGTGSGNRFPRSADERDYTVARCTIAPAQAGVADAATTCGTSYDERFNPSNTGNIRVNSRFSLTHSLTLTVDPFYEYTKANGGGTVSASEGRNPAGLVGYIGGTPYAGHDLNGDGDLLDRVTLLAPSNTITHRYGVITNLRYDLTPTQSFRVNYTLDYGRHRQTGEVGTLQINGAPTDVFPINNPLLDATGALLEKRDRFSKAILNQVSGEYRGKFIDERLTITGGVRAPFFERKLNNYCFTTSASGFVDCFGQNAATNALYAAAHPTYAPPQQRDLKYNKVLPSAGATFELTDHATVYASYTRGLQVPGTDNLYNSFYFAANDPNATPKPETSDNFDAGLRYRSAHFQAVVAGWYTLFNNRLASSFDPIEQVTVYRNLGKVHKYGIDGDLSYSPIPQLSFHAFGSYLKSKILDNVQTGLLGTNCAAADPTVLANQQNCAFTAGKRESGAPVYLFGGRVQGSVGPVEVGVQVKRTGPRYVNDQNTPVYQGGAPAAAGSYQVYGAEAAAYTVVDLDARFSLEHFGAREGTYFQLNVTNLFDHFYVGGFGGTLSNTSVTFTQVGAPRAISGTIVVSY